MLQKQYDYFKSLARRAVPIRQFFNFSGILDMWTDLWVTYMIFGKWQLCCNWIFWTPIFFVNDIVSPISGSNYNNWSSRQRHCWGSLYTTYLTEMISVIMFLNLCNNISTDIARVLQLILCVRIIYTEYYSINMFASNNVFWSFQKYWMTF